MSVKRYRSKSDWEEYEDGAFIRFADYDAALAVLRQCVEAMKDVPLVLNPYNREEVDRANKYTSALAAARKLLEEET